MYSSSGEWSDTLRQGDVVGRVALPLLGRTFEVQVESRSLVEAPSDGPKRVLVEASPTYVVIVSHDCEFNEGKRSKILVARLQAVPGNLSPDDLEKLRASNDAEAEAKATGVVAGVDNWLFDPLDGVFEREQVASFTTITPLPMTMAADLAAVKKAELVESERTKFRQKLAWFFARGPAG